MSKKAEKQEKQEKTAKQAKQEKQVKQTKQERPFKAEDYEYKLLHAENVLHYNFKDKEILLRALTHPSAVSGFTTEYSYERLEFLGDSLLGAYIAAKTYEQFPNFDEGKLTKLRVALVSGESLSEVASQIGLGQSIIFGMSEKGSGSRGMQSALEDVYEAIVAALYLDGGLEPMKKFINRTLINKLNKGLVLKKSNPKSLLQEKFQRHGKHPKYSIINEFGPPHNKTFIAEVMDGKKVLASGQGKTKKEAEANAAACALRQMK